jgi:hypothetical protein
MREGKTVVTYLVEVKCGLASSSLQCLREDEIAHEVTAQVLIYLAEIFRSANALGAMAGRAEEGVGQPETVSASVSFLAQAPRSAVG